ncbi:MAG: hypothetical protein R3F02_04255 [Thiolinea sp.]
MNKSLSLALMIIFSLNSGCVTAEATPAEQQESKQCVEGKTKPADNKTTEEKPSLEAINKKGMEGLQHAQDNDPKAAQKAFAEADQLAKERLGAGKQNPKPAQKKPAQKQAVITPEEKARLKKMSDTFMQGLDAKLDGNHQLAEQKFKQSDEVAKKHLNAK